MSTGSPMPHFEAAYLDLGRGFKWYVLRDMHAETARWLRRASGGPYASESEALMEIERRYQEIDDLYVAIEERAWREGYTVAW